MSSRVLLPESLTRWICEHLPAVGSPGDIRFNACARIPFWWIPGNRHVKGLTLWKTVYITGEHCPIDRFNRRTVELIFHELIHVEQFRRNPFLFPIRYFVGHLRYGYSRNPAEIEARDRASQLVTIYFKDSGGRGSAC